MATYLELKGDTFISRDAEEWRTEQMTKTLGQIAQEAADSARYDHKRSFSEQKAYIWEAAAQAVRAAVIEECAKVCEERIHIDGLHSNFICAKSIRALKDKQ